MGFRFRRSVKLLPGVRLNIGTRGVSTSIGGRGATVNIGRKGVRTTVGLPGTGLSYTSGTSRRPLRATGTPRSGGSSLAGWIVIGLIVLAVGSCIG